MTRKELMDKEAFRLYPTFVQDREIFRRGFEYADQTNLDKLKDIDVSCYGRLHNIWHNIRQRCNNSKAQGYEYYGGRGIKVCKEWESFIVFAVWSIISGYNDKLTIDRINNDGGYSPDNCRWTDAITQANNTSRNHIVGGKTVAQYSSEVRMNYRTLHDRVSRCKMNINEALNAPLYKPKKVYQYDLSGNFIAEYQSSKIASNYIGGGTNGRYHINRVCRGERKSAFGYIWKYIKD